MAPGGLRVPLAPNPLVPALQPPHPAAHCPSPRLPSLWRKRGRCVCSFPNSESSGCRCSLTSGFTAPPMPSGGGGPPSCPGASGTRAQLVAPAAPSTPTGELPLPAPAGGFPGSPGPAATRQLLSSTIAPPAAEPPPRPSQEATPGVGGTQLPRLSSRACPFIFL